jgi:hypothetical protein
VAARESSLLSPSGSKAGKAHRVPISSQEAFFLSGRVKSREGRDFYCLSYGPGRGVSPPWHRTAIQIWFRNEP